MFTFKPTLVMSVTDSRSINLQATLAVSFTALFWYQVERSVKYTSRLLDKRYAQYLFSIDGHFDVNFKSSLSSLNNLIIMIIFIFKISK